MRAPPDAEITSSGVFVSSANSAALGDYLADTPTHAAAHKREIHGSDHHRRSLDCGCAIKRGIRIACLRLSLRQARGVRARVNKPEDIDWPRSRG